jgi:hypothetical protein
MVGLDIFCRNRMEIINIFNVLVGSTKSLNFRIPCSFIPISLELRDSLVRFGSLVIASAPSAPIRLP